MKNIFFSPILCISLFFFSCQKLEKDSNIEKVPNEFILKSTEAKVIGELYQKKSITLKSNSKTKRSHIHSSTAQKTLPVFDSYKNPLYYIITYGNGGFLILSGDKRIQPILAFSESETFPLTTEYPEGLQEWFFDTKNVISNIRYLEMNQDSSIGKLWTEESLLKEINVITMSDTGGMVIPCVRQRDFKKGPLVTSTWDQGSPYNSALPNMNCTQTSNGRPFTGCVATAMSQVMRYHKYPTKYNWNDMPLNQGNGTIANIMLDVGHAVNMEWGCAGSGANTQKGVPNAFKKKFNYASAQYKDINHVSEFMSTIIPEIYQKRPVIMRGGRNVNGAYTGGHAWICDGIWSTYYYNMTNCRIEQESHRYHMNWGWGGSFDGWFVYSQNPGNSDFTYKRGIVYNIKP